MHARDEPARTCDGRTNDGEGGWTDVAMHDATGGPAQAWHGPVRAWKSATTWCGWGSRKQSGVHAHVEASEEGSKKRTCNDVDAPFVRQQSQARMEARKTNRVLAWKQHPLQLLLQQFASSSKCIFVRCPAQFLHNRCIKSKRSVHAVPAGLQWQVQGCTTHAHVFDIALLSTNENNTAKSKLKGACINLAWW